MKEPQSYKFKSTYELADLIDNSVQNSVNFWNYDEVFFIKAATKFSKDTLLHLYIVTTAMNFYRKDFLKNGDNIEEEAMEKWYNLFEHHSIDVEKFNFESDRDTVDWFDEHIDRFVNLFDAMADECFYILFGNRYFLLDFNKLVSETIKDTKFQKKFITKKGTLKRTNIPQWVKDAVFHRNKGRCVFCNVDLTRMVNILTNNNYDHIIPLDLYGSNDPCNIQLSCEHCNKSKTNKIGNTTTNYFPWWTRE